MDFFDSCPLSDHSEIFLNRLKKIGTGIKLLASSSLDGKIRPS
jgi:hypothetical protein